MMDAGEEERTHGNKTRNKQLLEGEVQEIDKTRIFAQNQLTEYQRINKGDDIQFVVSWQNFQIQDYREYFLQDSSWGVQVNTHKKDESAWNCASLK